MFRPWSSACWRATVRVSSDWSSPVVSAPAFARVSVRMPPPQPTSTTLAPLISAWSKIKLARSGLMTCSMPILPCGSHHSWLMRSNLPISSGSIFKGWFIVGVHAGAENGDDIGQLAAADVVDKYAAADGVGQGHVLAAVAVFNAVEQRLPHQVGVQQRQVGLHVQLFGQGEEALGAGG